MLYAKRVLSDVEHIHAMLEAEEDNSKFRILWVSALALIRAVGHVLKECDCKYDGALNLRVSNFFAECNSSRKENKIYFDFIKKERDLILKEYEFNYSESATLLGYQENDVIAVSLDQCIFCPINEGPYANEDCRDVLAIAISWWHTKLKMLEVDGKKQ